jgi:hypothetical protein
MKNDLNISASSTSKFDEWKRFQASLGLARESNQALIKTAEQPSLLIQHLSKQFAK